MSIACFEPDCKFSYEHMGSYPIFQSLRYLHDKLRPLDCSFGSSLNVLFLVLGFVQSIQVSFFVIDARVGLSRKSLIPEPTL